MVAKKMVRRVTTPRLFFLGILFGSLLIFFSSAGRSVFLSLGEAVSFTGVGITSAFAKSVYAARLWWSSVFQAHQLSQTIKRLKHQIAKLESENRKLRLYEEENKRLRSLLKLKHFLATSAIAAEVISLGGSNWFRTAIIDKGYKDGVKNGSPVIDYNGLIGRIWETRRHHSVVLLITDRRSSVGVLFSRKKNVYGILKGTGGRLCELIYLSRNIKPNKGELLVTSGLGGVFPKEILVGKIVRVIHTSDPPKCLILPFYEQKDLHEVIVLSESPLKLENPKVVDR